MGIMPTVIRGIWHSASKHDPKDAMDQYPSLNGELKDLREIFKEETEHCISRERLKEAEAEEVVLHMAFCGRCRQEYTQ